MSAVIGKIILLFVFYATLPGGSLSVSFPEHQSDEEFGKEVLNVHNEHRKVHNGENSDLKLNDDLSKEAKELAEEAARDADGELFKNPGPGENVLMACSTYNRALSGRQVSDSW